jgi:FkbM family methyltransferase
MSSFEGEDVAARMNAAYDAQTVEVMRRCLRADSNCVDVGCHEGSILREMLRWAPAGSHYAFEPLPELYEGLLASFPGVRVYPLALSDAAGEVSFQRVTSNLAYSGLKRRHYPSPDEAVEVITVKAELLDHVIPEGLSVALVKIDVEGAELQVLRGALRTIRRSRPFIIFEHGLGAADFYGTTPEEVYDLLTAQAGLRISLMEDWLAGRGPLSREQFCDQFQRSANFYFMAHPL